MGLKGFLFRCSITDDGVKDLFLLLGSREVSNGASFIFFGHTAGETAACQADW